ncbi:hypothetical protein NKI30_19505 [Mesorhizobium opportunistum]|uniref:hypothetical protein n=1 Tax=Mesorhizobium opportunistum TaxID=593909 RepID=UPI00333D4B8A
MNASTQPEKLGESRAYWTHEVRTYPSPVSVIRMAQLIDFDDRLYENARIVYRFLISWYHEDFGDALMSMRHVSKVMRSRAPDGVKILSHSVVQRGIIALMEAGWVARTFKGRGKGKGASRYVPVLNVLDLAAQGKFPQPSHSGGTVEPSHANGTLVTHANGTVAAELSHANGTKTLLPDPRTDAETGNEDIDCPPPADGLAATAAGQGGFDELYSAYGVRKEYAAARVEYEKLAPDAALHAEMVKAARAWRTAGGGIERMHLARWIREGRYREDPKGERKAKPPADKPAEAATAKPKPDFTIYPDETTTAVIDRAVSSIDDEDGAPLLEVFYKAPDGREVEHFLVLNEDYEEEIAELKKAAGVDCLTHETLAGKHVELVLNRGKFISVHRSWSPPPSVARPVKFEPKFSVVPKAETDGRAMAKVWAAQFNDEAEEAA